MPDFEALSVPAPRKSPPFRLTGWHVGGIALAFFLIVATMNGVMMRHAFRTMPGLDARNGYDVSQRYNTSIKDARLQAARGWRTDLNVAREGNSTLLTTTIRGADGEPIRGLALSIAFRHPATRAHDDMRAAIELAPGRYQLAHDVSAGIWDVEISARESASPQPLILSRNRIIVKE